MRPKRYPYSRKQEIEIVKVGYSTEELANVLPESLNVLFQRKVRG